VCPRFGESCQGLRQWALVQRAEALGGAGEGDVELGRAARAVGEPGARIGEGVSCKQVCHRLFIDNDRDLPPIGGM
jgi:hypothetical protein